jgi:hypothetical protein
MQSTNISEFAGKLKQIPDSGTDIIRAGIVGVIETIRAGAMMNAQD